MVNLCWTSWSASAATLTFADCSSATLTLPRPRPFERAAPFATCSAGPSRWPTQNNDRTHIVAKRPSGELAPRAQHWACPLDARRGRIRMENVAVTIETDYVLRSLQRYDGIRAYRPHAGCTWRR